MKIFSSTGTLVYSDSPLKLILSVDQGISDFYFSTVPKTFKIRKQMYPAHVSVVRNSSVPKYEFWGKYSGKVIEFEYEDMVYNDETYYWLNVFCKDLEDIREELGLTKSGDVSLSPDGRHKFHITIGNSK